MMTAMHYVKSHGLGNDYIVIDPAKVPFRLTREAVQLICDRHLGIGSDGILEVIESRGADFGVRIFNPDGSDAEKSGNGIRIFAKYLREHGYTTKDRFAVDTAGGRVAVQLALHDGLVTEVSADMGTVTFDALEFLQTNGHRFPVTSLSIGNPHCVVIVDDLSKVDPHALGPLIETHHAFPDKRPTCSSPRSCRARTSRSRSGSAVPGTRSPRARRAARSPRLRIARAWWIAT